METTWIGRHPYVYGYMKYQIVEHLYDLTPPLLASCRTSLALSVADAAQRVPASLAARQASRRRLRRAPTTTLAASPTATTTPQTLPMPATQTTCPADGQARAAVMARSGARPNQNLVYIYNEVPENTSASLGHLRRYDVSNGHKAEITSSGLRIEQAQVSQDGQWVLFLSHSRSPWR